MAALTKAKYWAQRALQPLAERRADRAYERTLPDHAEPWHERGAGFARAWPTAQAAEGSGDDNPLRAFSDARTVGRGVWKWDHYLDLYHRHFERFRNTEVHILEIGIYSGGSLDMWHDYFGPRCHVYGVDNQSECLRYADERTTVFIGDQADPEFWQRFRAAVPQLDIAVDDGGHQPDQQACSLEELLPHLRPGGVYVVEDLHGVRNPFVAYLQGLIEELNAYHGSADYKDPERRKASSAGGLQSSIGSIHYYPFAAVIEKRRAPVGEFVAPKRGTEWEPFFR